MEDEFFNIDNYEFKFFLEGIEIPIKASRIQIGKRMSFSVDIPPADFNFKPFCWGVLIYRENTDPWKVAAHGLYSGENINKNIASRKYSLQFVPMKFIYDSIRFLEMTNNESFAYQTKAFMGDHSVYFDEIENTEQYNTELLDNVFSTLSDGDLDDFVASIINREGEEGEYVNNLFTKEHLKNYHYNKKNGFKVVVDENVEGHFKQRVANGDMQQILQSTGGQIVLTEILDRIFHIFKYDMHHIPGGLKEDEPKELLIKPTLHIGIPPACNVMFPHETYSFNYQRDFQSKPTRFRLKAFANTTKGDKVPFFYYAPQELNKGIVEGDGDDKFLTEEEKFRNIIPAQEQHNIYELIPTDFNFELTYSSDNEEELEDVEAEGDQDVVIYEYFEKRYENFNTSINCRLKMGLLPGLPGVVLDEPNSIVGHIQSISHFIDLEGATGGTSVRMSHSRKDNIDMPVLTGWYDDDIFKPDEIGELFKDLGTDTYYAKEEIKPTEIDEDDRVNLKESLDELLEHYKEIPKIAHSQEFLRNLPTAKKFLKTMNLKFNEEVESIEPIDEDEPHPFNIEVGDTKVSEKRKESVLAYKTRLGEVTSRDI